MTSPTTTHLLFTVGTTPDGGTIVRDLAHIPHVLVCGSTGSGKSNFLHSLICSLVRDHSPDEVRVLLADPKIVEFPPYASLPHLLAPVVRNTPQAVQALRWLDGVIARRVADRPRTGHPRIVVVIDEFSDFMIQERETVEPLVTRVAMSGAAVGIHLVIATVRPAATVFTNGLLATIPARLVFRLVGADDFAKRSGAPEAKDLAGRGDGFWREPCGELLRVRTPFVPEDEIHRIVAAAKASSSGTKAAFSFPTQHTESLDAESLFKKAKTAILETGRASESVLQRKTRDRLQRRRSADVSA